MKPHPRNFATSFSPPFDRTYTSDDLNFTAFSSPISHHLAIDTITLIICITITVIPRHILSMHLRCTRNILIGVSLLYAPRSHIVAKTPPLPPPKILHGRMRTYARPHHHSLLSYVNPLSQHMSNCTLSTHSYNMFFTPTLFYAGRIFLQIHIAPSLQVLARSST